MMLKNLLYTAPGGNGRFGHWYLYLRRGQSTGFGDDSPPTFCTSTAQGEMCHDTRNDFTATHIDPDKRFGREYGVARSLRKRGTFPLMFCVREAAP